MSRLLIIPIYTFTLNWFWKKSSVVAWGFSCAQIWALWILNMPLQVKVAFSAHTINWENSLSTRWAFTNYSQNSTRLPASPATNSCTRRMWKACLPSRLNILRIVSLGMAISTEAFLKLVEGSLSKWLRTIFPLGRAWWACWSLIPQNDLVSLRTWCTLEKTSRCG